MPTNTFGEDITKTGGSIVPTYDPLSSISSQTLQGGAQINYSSPGVSSPYPINGINVELDQQQQDVQNQTTDLQRLNDELAGKSAYESSQTTAQGIPALLSTQQDLVDQITGLQNQSKSLANEANYTIPNQMQQNAEGRGVTAAGLAPLTAGELRKNQIKQGAVASQALTLSSNLAAIQGKIGTAYRAVEDAIKEKYGPKEAEYEAKSKNLALVLNSPAFTQAEKNRAAAQQKKEDAEKAATDKQKQNETDAQKAVVDILHANPNVDPKTLASLRSATNPFDVALIAQQAGLVFDTSGGFELSPGQARYDAKGNLIASRAPTATLSGGGADGGGGVYNGDFAATIDLAAQLGGTNQQRAQIKANLQGFIANHDYQSAYASIVQATSKGLTGANASNFQQQANSLGVLDSLKSAVQKYADTGGNTNIFKGTADQIQTKIGALATDPKYAALAVQMNAAFQNYRLQMTGAAFGVKESAEYASILPSPGNTLDLNLAKLGGAQAYLNSSVESSIKSVIGQGGIFIKEYAEGANSVAPASTTQAPVDDEFTGWLQANGL